MRGPAHPARPHGAQCFNSGVMRRHLKLVAQARRAKLSHDSAVSGRTLTGLDAPMPPAPRGPAMGDCRNSGLFLFRSGGPVSNLEFSLFCGRSG